MDSRHPGRATRRWTLALLLAATAAGWASQKGAARTGDAAAADSATTTGRVATARDWEGRNAARVEELFVGRFPGVQVYQASGGIQVRIRGGTSLRGSNEPLYIVDGFPYTPGSDGLIALNPSDIAKIEVLKDAGQIAEYGSRGANGVVRITTKRGGR
ncbi:MAG: TonB-dependent receptor plug domain-containing protein [Gemmatirosa sp.]